MYSRSSAPSSRTTCSRPSASAASEPGSGASHSSARSAVRVLIGSIETTYAPFFCASRMNLNTWWPLVSGFVPQRMISFECANASGSIPDAVPVV